MLILANIFYMSLFFSMGFALIYFRKHVKEWTGNFVWAEQYLGHGGTYLVLILLGLFMMFYAVVYPFGGMQVILNGLLGRQNQILETEAPREK